MPILRCLSHVDDALYYAVHAADDDAFDAISARLPAVFDAAARTRSHRCLFIRH